MYIYDQFEYLKQVKQLNVESKKFVEQLSKNFFLELNVYKSSFQFSQKNKTSFDYQYYTPATPVQKLKFLYIPSELEQRISQEWGTQNPQTQLFENLQRIQSLTNFLQPLREVYRQIFFPKMNFGINPRQNVSVQITLFYLEQFGEQWYTIIQEPILQIQYFISPTILSKEEQQRQEQTGQQQTTQVQITRTIGNLLEKQQNIFKIAQVKPSDHIFAVNIQNVIFMPQQLIKSFSWEFPMDSLTKSKRTRYAFRPTMQTLSFEFMDIYPIIYRQRENIQKDQFNQPLVQEDVYSVVIENNLPKVIKR